jgi:hypothetical protein
LRILISTPFLGSVGLGVHTMLYAGMAILIGFQAVAFASFTKIFAISEGLLPPDPKLMTLFRFINLELGIVCGALLCLFGIAGSIFAVQQWGEHSFGALDPAQEMKIVIPSAVSFTLGLQVILSSFFLSVLGLRRLKA